MKRLLVGCSTAVLLATIFLSCNPTEVSEEATLIPEYAVNITAVSAQNAPALQSFAHGVNGADWLLFAGRTNRINDDGGLHKINGNSDYASTSFIPLSFNNDIFVYNAEKDSVWALSFDEMVSKIESYQPPKDSTGLATLLPQLLPL